MTENASPYRALRPQAEVSAEFVGRNYVISKIHSRYGGLHAHALRAVEHPAGFMVVEMGLEDGSVIWLGSSLFAASTRVPSWTSEHRSMWAASKKDAAASGADLAPWLEGERAKHEAGLKAHKAYIAQKASDERERRAEVENEKEQMRQARQYKAAVRRELHHLIKH